jgi:hypothetical protein
MESKCKKGKNGVDHLLLTYFLHVMQGTLTLHGGVAPSKASFRAQNFPKAHIL